MRIVSEGVKGFLSNKTEENFNILPKKLLKTYQITLCGMSLKIHFMYSYVDLLGAKS